MKIKDQIILGLEDIKNMRFPFLVKLVFYTAILSILMWGILFLLDQFDKLKTYNWVPLILLIQTIIIIFQLKIIYDQAKYGKIPFLPEFNIEKIYFSKSSIYKKEGYGIMLKNLGDIAHRVNCKVKWCKKEKVLNELDFGKLRKGAEEKILDFLEIDQFKKEPIRIYFTYYDKVGNRIYSRWFKPADKMDFYAILTGQEQ